MKKTKGLSTAELIGLDSIEETYFQTTEGEKTVFFLLKPSNLSVLSNESLNAKIYGLMTVLKGVTEIGMMCLNSRENFEDNKRFLKKRLEEEKNPVVRKLIEADLHHLDRMQVQMATAREFLLVIRPKEKKEKEMLLFLNRVQKILEEQGFHVKQATKGDIKRILAVYFEQNVTTEVFEDTDGERWVIFGE